jgi:hypothetical protein
MRPFRLSKPRACRTGLRQLTGRAGIIVSPPSDGISRHRGVQPLDRFAAAQLRAAAEHRRRPGGDAEASRLAWAPATGERQYNAGHHATAGADRALRRNRRGSEAPDAGDGRERRAFGPERDDEDARDAPPDDLQRRTFLLALAGDVAPAQLLQFT